MARLIVIETLDQEAYLFSGSSLRDVVGASELVQKIGTSFVQRAIDGAAIDALVSAPGMAVLSADTADTAKGFIERWSEIVVENAPGVDALAACPEAEFDINAPLEAKNGYMTVFRDAQQKLDRLRADRALGICRFQRLPVVAPCDFSAFPAAEMLGGRCVSRITRAKIDASQSQECKDRIATLFGNGQNVQGDLENLQWLGIVRTTVRGPENRLGGDNVAGRQYRERLEAFAAAGRDAFARTVSETWRKGERAKIVPVLVDGGNIVAVLDGRRAIQFATRFVQNFQQHPTFQQHPAAGILCAGVCVAKPSFPFSASCKLAAELLQSAKNAATQTAAIDFHILYDSAATSLADIREKLTIAAEHARLTSKPLIMGTASTTHDYERFRRIAQAIAAFKKQTAGSRTLPISQAYNIREALFSQNREMQEILWGYLMKNYQGFAGIWRNAVPAQTLYQEENNVYVTYFLDALEASEFFEAPDAAQNGGGQGA
ncbi:MAG: hypothetical protein LBQ90_12195 [Synergistaceae bacterium]|jgi:hypothetical protein|nr:hypothetical protein [Synergistaceae bacterium]